MSERTVTGLAAFTGRQQGLEESAVDKPRTKRKRGQGETVAITVRLTREQWERLHQFAISEGDSLQGLALRGLSLLLQNKGLSGI